MISARAETLIGEGADGAGGVVRVLAATIALNNTVEVGLVTGVIAMTTPTGSATHSSPASMSSSTTTVCSGRSLSYAAV